MVQEKEKCSPHGWTTDTLELYLSNKIDNVEKLLASRIDDMDKSIEVAIVATDKAASRADEAMQKRLDTMNEFRATISDQAARLLPRTEYSVMHSSLMDKVDGALTRMTAIENRVSITDPALTTEMTALKASVSSLISSDYTRSGSEKSDAIGTTRLISIVAIIVAAIVGIGQVYNNFSKTANTDQLVQQQLVDITKSRQSDIDQLNARINSLTERLNAKRQ